MPQGLPTVIPNEVILASYANSTADRVVGRFATIAERDAAIPSPVDGMVCSVAGYTHTRTGGVWKLAPVPVMVRADAAAADYTSATLVPIPPILTLPTPPPGATHVQGTFSVGYVSGGGSPGLVASAHFEVRNNVNASPGDVVTVYFQTFVVDQYLPIIATSRWPVTTAPPTMQLHMRRISGTAAIRVTGAPNGVGFVGYFI